MERKYYCCLILIHINLQGEKKLENGICATQYKSQLEQSIKNNKEKKYI